MDTPKLVAVTPREKYRIWVRYSDGAQGEVDLGHLAGKGVFKFWDIGSNFQKAHVSDGGAVAWTDDIEICPDNVYLRLTGKSVAELFPSQSAALSHVGD
ncbi:MAG: DUF2442 domain-containing protein [Verrucomicrobia bacterium]|nr:DUF2442 domain-containing protein [Verrucomicrobiota bacterium]